MCSLPDELAGFDEAWKGNAKVHLPSWSNKSGMHSNTDKCCLITNCTFLGSLLDAVVFVSLKSLWLVGWHFDLDGMLVRTCSYKSRPSLVLYKDVNDCLNFSYPRQL